MTTPFQGELMVCGVCSAQELSSPTQESDWRYIQVDTRAWHVCPRHFPPDGASEEVVQEVYAWVLKRLLGAP